MKCIIIFWILLASNYCSAQHFKFSYDYTGNRTHRQYIIPRLANPDKDSIMVSKFGINIFPNPVAESVNIRIAELAEGKSATVQLISLSGNVLNEKKQSAKQETFDLSGFSSGIYFINVWIDEESALYKIEKF